MKYQAVIFDFNGTLLWDTPFHDRAFDIFLDKYGISLTEEEKKVKIHGKTNNDIMPAIFERELSADEIAGFALEKELIYQGLIKNDLKLADGAEALFDDLKKKGVPFTIATSAGIENIDFYFKYMPLSRWFDQSMIVYNDGTLAGKPAPDLFVKAMEKLGVRPENVIICEDSPAGIKAAENANAGKVVIVNSIDSDFSTYSHQVIKSFDEIDRNLF